MCYCFNIFFCCSCVSQACECLKGYVYDIAAPVMKSIDHFDWIFRDFLKAFSCYSCENCWHRNDTEIGWTQINRGILHRVYCVCLDEQQKRLISHPYRIDIDNTRRKWNENWRNIQFSIWKILFLFSSRRVHIYFIIDKFEESTNQFCVRVNDFCHWYCFFFFFMLQLFCRLQARIYQSVIHGSHDNRIVFSFFNDIIICAISGWSETNDKHWKMEKIAWKKTIWTSSTVKNEGEKKCITESLDNNEINWITNWSYWIAGWILPSK